jgi:hypothetical protein
MSRFIVIALAALAISAGAASADPFAVVNKITTNGTHLDGLSVGIAAQAVDAVVLSAGATVDVR